MEEIEIDKRKIFLVVLPFFIPVVMYFYFYPPQSYVDARKLNDKMRHDFIVDTIKEKIIKIDYQDHATLIVLKNGKSYLSGSLHVIGDEYNTLMDAAEKGDSLIKEDSISFTLKKKNGKEYEFFFNGPGEYSY